MTALYPLFTSVYILGALKQFDIRRSGEGLVHSAFTCLCKCPPSVPIYFLILATIGHCICIKHEQRIQKEGFGRLPQFGLSSFLVIVTGLSKGKITFSLS